MSCSNGVLGNGSDGGAGLLPPCSMARIGFDCGSCASAGASTGRVWDENPVPTLNNLLSSAAGSTICSVWGSADTSGKASLARWLRPSLATSSSKSPLSVCGSGIGASSAVVSPRSTSSSSVSVTPAATGGERCAPERAFCLSSLFCCLIHPLRGPRKGATM